MNPLKPRLHFVLVETIYPSNIGATARALANMGGQSLHLVAPKASVNGQARRGAAGAQSLLDQRKTYENWEEFLSQNPNGLRIALSARIGKNRDNLEITDFLKSKENYPSDIYFVFGREDNGLNVNDLSQCHQTCYLPTFGEFTSLNLAQATLMTGMLFNITFRQSEKYEAISSPAPLPESTIKNWLNTLGYDLSAPKKNIFLSLKKMLLRAHPTQEESKLLDSALQQTLRKLPSKK